MSKLRTLSALFFVSNIFSVAPAWAQQSDLGAWAIFSTGGPVSKDSKVTVSADVQARFNNDIGNLGQFLARARVGYKITDGFNIGGGYAYIRNNPENGNDSEENRIFQQASFTIAKGSNLKITGRSRFEQRFIEGPNNDVGLRFRQQVKLTVPLTNKGNIKAVIWSEPFININDTDFGANSGLDRWRNFIGVNIPISKKISLEPGYLNQFINRRGRPDLSEHIIAVGFNTKF